jgi:hypothetical protein
MFTKRFWFLLMALVVGVVMAGCSTPTEAPVVQPTSTSQVAEPSPTPLPPTATPVPPTVTPEPETPTDTPEPPSPTATLEPTMEAEQLLWQPDGIVTDGEYADQVEIAGVTFAWTTDAEFLYGAMWAQTGGWVAVGFDPDNRMQGANYVFGFVKDGEVAIVDMFGTRPAGPDSHPPDDTLGGADDIEAFGGSEKDGVTLIEFKIPRETGDDNDKPLASGAYVLLAAYGSTDDFTMRHTNRGIGEITID